MPEEFSEPATDAVPFDHRWYFFHSNWSDGNGSETQEKKQIGMWGSETLWLN